MTSVLTIVNVIGMEEYVNKLFLMAFAFALLMSGCMVNSTIAFEDTNAFFVRENIRSLDLSPLDEFIKPGDKVVLVPLDDEINRDTFLTATFEDEIINKLLEAGYPVLERDDDLIYRLISECDESYSHYRKIKSESETAIGASGSSDNFASSSHGLLAIGGAKYSSSGSSRSYEEHDALSIDSKLNTADKIIAYRILENGIIFEDPQSDIDTKINRKAKLVVSFRIEDTKSSQILAIKELTANREDLVNKDDIPALSQMHFRNYSFAYPNAYGNPEVHILNKQGGSSGSKKNLLWVIIGIVGAVALGIAAVAQS
jgi:hypothetical protein